MYVNFAYNIQCMLILPCHVQLIELKAHVRREAKEAENRLERNILAQNPINWNQSLT